jgi:antitoxin (DNA-binding transcriptional repressor) of toxin-antitoxin stability system
MPIEITFAELEAHYFEILKRVCQGESFTVTIDGRPVAEIRPSHRGGADAETLKVFEELCSPRFDGASDEAIREWLGEGGNKAGTTSEV